MDKDDKVFVAGASGMVGSAILRGLRAMGFTNLIGSYHSRRPKSASFIQTSDSTKCPELIQLDLTDQEKVNGFFESVGPRYVIMAAARVGGIVANDTHPAEFIYENLTIQTHILHAAYRAGIDRLMFLGSSCIYPRQAPQPMREEYLLTGTLEPTNEPYAIAKIAGLKMCEAYNRQYGTRFLALMPTNLYGPNDNFDLENSHVIPALIRKFHEAKIGGNGEVTIWGSGTPMREFLHVDDLASACLYVMNLDQQAIKKAFINYPQPSFLNVGTGVECTISQLSEIVRDVIGYNGRIVFNTSKPDGTPRKLLDIARISGLGWKPVITLIDGIKQTYAWYLKNYVGCE
jgi:GDP-L-fucose synthase